MYKNRIMFRKLHYMVLLVAGVLLGMWATPAQAANESETAAYALSVYADYGYNYTWENYGGATLLAYLPINPHFEAEVGARLLSSNVHTFQADLRPVFPLPVGALYLSTHVIYTASFRNQIQDVAASLGIGYKMDYVNVQFGLQTRLIDALGRDPHSASQIVYEAPHLLYGIEACVRPESTSVWNLSLRFANFDEFQIERMWQPLFAIGGRYDINKNWRVLADVTCKPTGMFHLNASFYGIQTRAGFTYSF